MRLVIEVPDRLVVSDTLRELGRAAKATGESLVTHGLPQATLAQLASRTATIRVQTGTHEVTIEG